MTESCKSFEWGTFGGEGGGVGGGGGGGGGGGWGGAGEIMKPNQTQKPMLFVHYKKEP